MTNELTSREPEEISADIEAESIENDKKEGSEYSMRKNSTKIKAKKLKENPSCYVCQNGTFYILELHHVVPISNGGADCETNTELLCPNCHAFIHFIISDKASEYIPEDETLSETISRYTNNPISKHRMSKLINRWAAGIKERVETEVVRHDK